MKRLIIVLVMGLSCFVSTAYANTYYVDKLLPGSDSNNGLSEAAPFLTIQKCFTTLSTRNTPGDTCLVKNGTYTESPYLSPLQGTAVNPITIQNYPGHSPVINASGTGTNGVNFNSDATLKTQKISYVVFSGFEIKNAIYEGFKYVNADHLTIQYNYIHDNLYDGIFGVGINVTIKNNHVFRNGNPGVNNGHGLYITGNSTTVTNNLLIANQGFGVQVAARCATQHAQYPSQSYGDFSNSLIANNTMAYSYNAGGMTLWFAEGCGSISSDTIANNIFFENAHQAGSANGMKIFCCPSSVVVKNNVSYATSGVLTFINNVGCTSCTFSNNCPASTSGNCATNPSMANATASLPASPDFNLTSSSTIAIDMGSDVGLAYNGSAPDVGAFETFSFSTCSIANGTPSVINVTFTNNRFPPVLPASSPGTFTARKAGASNAVTGTTRTGDNQIDITVTNAYVAGNAADISWASGNLTDSALIGGTLNQVFFPITNQACTNNVGSAPSHLFIQAKFEFHGLRGTEAAPVIVPYSAAPENTNLNVAVGGRARLRIAITCSTADCPPTGFFPFYACAACTTAGTYTLIPDSFATDEDIALCGTGTDTDVPTSGTATTDQLSTTGTFVPGALVFTSNAIPTIDLAQDNKTELEYCIKWDTDAVANRVYTFRVYKQDSTAIDTYTVTPQVTIRSMSAGLGF